jgi:regulator of sirC expression with transglutaminase-like and TPR domain
MNRTFFCRPEAFRLFAEGIQHLETTRGLVQAALAISLHALDDTDLAKVEQRLDALAERVRVRTGSQREEALLAHLHHVLFDEEGFLGERANYYNPLNSYLPAVLESRRGNPITLSLIYKAVGERVGLTIEGVNSPGHFLVRVRDSRGWLLIDPYHQGRSLTDREAAALIDQVFSQPPGRDYNLDEPATHSQWIERMLANLFHTFAAYGCRADQAAMVELHAVLAGVTI